MLEGFRYRPDLIDTAYESVLLTHIRELPFREFEFHGYLINLVLARAAGKWRLFMCERIVAGTDSTSP